MSTGRKRFTFRKSSVSHGLCYDDWCRAFDILMAIVEVKSFLRASITDKRSGVSIPPGYCIDFNSHKADVCYLYEKFPTTDAWFTYDLEFVRQWLHLISMLSGGCMTLFCTAQPL